MKQMKKILVLAVAFTMLMNSCIFNISMQKVYASEDVEAEQESEIPEEVVSEQAEIAEDGLRVTGIALSEETPVQLSPLAVPADFTVNVEMTAPADEKVTGVDLQYYCEETGNSNSYNKWYGTEEAWSPGAEGGTARINIEVNEYVPKGHYLLQSITVYTDKNNDAYLYMYNEEKKAFVRASYSDGEETVIHEFTYSGEVDYVVEQSEEDLSAPDITSVKMNTSGTIYSNTEVSFDIGYTEEGSGVKTIEMIYRNEDTVVEDGSSTSYSADAYFFSASSKKEYVGDGTVTVRSVGRFLGEYTLYEIYIEDYAGNSVRYTSDGSENPGELVSDRGDGKTLSVTDHTYTVSPAEGAAGLKAVRITGDKDNLAAGDTFEAILTLQNVTGNSINVYPEQSFIFWMKEGEMKSENSDGIGNMITLAPGEEKEIAFQVKLKNHMTTGSWKLSSITINTDAGNSIYNVWNNMLQGRDAAGGVIVDVPYNGELDYTVAISETPDEEAPYIASVDVLTKNIKAPGEVQFAIQAQNEGYLKAKYVNLAFHDVNNSKNRFVMRKKGDNIELSYSEQEKAYIGTGELPFTVVTGTYVLDYIIIGDEDKNFRTYNMSDGKLVDSEGNECPMCELIVAEAEETDRDFDAPQLNEFALVDGNVKAGEKVQYKINMTDASGISGIQLIYQDTVTYDLLVLRNMDVVSETDENVYSFQVDKYCEEGQYRLLSVMIMDDSVRKNVLSCTYERESSELVVYNSSHSGIEQSIKVNGSTELNVMQGENIVITNTVTGNLIEDAGKVGKGGTIVVKDREYDRQILPQEFLDIVKEKEATIIVTDRDSNSELVIDSASLGNVSEKLELSVCRDGIVNDGTTITVGNQEDNIYYPVTVVTSDTAIPVTIRIRLDDDFIKKCGDNPVRLSRLAEDLSTVLVKDNLKISEDGYVEVTFENGFSGGISSQTLFANGSEVQRAGNETLGFVVSSKAEKTEGFKIGDIDGDGKIAMADLMMCLHHVSGRKLLTGREFQAADIDGDGTVAMKDLMKILHYVSGRNTNLTA